ncbi:MAG: ABC transporter ATP-binding protein [Alphaproteobacteria bacterium]|jgi:oligopeptide/dipeptide ABC transporter ATP-binding protein|nr:ABC transporter ATP-binding protein [Alphaproteobacteria bacterium]
MSGQTRQAALSVRELHVSFRGDLGAAKAVDGVSYDLYPGETLAVVGESGCGKSVSALAILRLIPSPPGRIDSGSIDFEGRGLLDMNERSLYQIRGNKISMIFQEPMTSLNPVLTIGRQLTEALQFHLGMSRREARERALEMLDLVQISEGESRLKQYPHQLSGGMRQRVMIAMALSCEPRVLIADEPTTALDVTIQAQILDLMADLQDRLGTAIILITHDLGVVAQMADRVVIMYAGKIVEQAPVNDLFDAPRHPYTEGLLRALPRLDRLSRGAGEDRLSEMPGIVPSIYGRPPGCAFAPRCPLATEQCRSAEPPLAALADDHLVACWVRAPGS